MEDDLGKRVCWGTQMDLYKTFTFICLVLAVLEKKKLQVFQLNLSIYIL